MQTNIPHTTFRIAHAHQAASACTKSVASKSLKLLGDYSSPEELILCTQNAEKATNNSPSILSRSISFLKSITTKRAVVFGVIVAIFIAIYAVYKFWNRNPASDSKKESIANNKNHQARLRSREAEVEHIHANVNLHQQVVKELVQQNQNQTQNLLAIANVAENQDTLVAKIENDSADIFRQILKEKDDINIEQGIKISKLESTIEGIKSSFKSYEEEIHKELKELNTEKNALKMENDQLKNLLNK